MLPSSKMILQLTAVLCVIMQLGSSQNDDNTIVQCSTSLNCGGNLSTMTRRQCCVERDDGLAFTIEGDSTCHVCIVFGWFQESFTGNEQGVSNTILAGYKKGREAAGRNLVFNVKAIDGTARQGSGLDYTVGNTVISALFQQSTAHEVVVTFLVDGVALEADENFVLELILLPEIIPPMGEGVFFINRITMTILDSDNVNIFFTEDDYRGSESSLRVPVRISKDRRIATDVILTVNPMTISQAEELEGVLPGAMPEDPYSPNRADFADFDNSTLTVTFQADEANPVNELSVPVTIIDDDVNEAMEQDFVVVLRLRESTNQGSVHLGTRNSSLCRIIDDDEITIGFEQSSYTFTEPNSARRFSDGPVFIAKVNRRSEQTFPLVLQVSSSAPDSSTGLATLSEVVNGTVRNNDYVLTTPGNLSVVVNLLPSQQKIPFSFTLFPDNLPESNEAFQASFSPGNNAPSFDVSLAETFIIISDNDDVVIGFESTSYTVNEGVAGGTLEVCVRVFNPENNQPLSATIDLTIQSLPGTASGNDFVELSAAALSAVVTFNNGHRRDCFDVTITNDKTVEQNENFRLELRFITGISQSGVVLRPNMATVTILDDDAVIGFINQPYTVSESDGQVNLQVGLLEGTLQNEIVVSLTTNDSTATSGSDYLSVTSRQLTFSPSSNLVTVPVTIIDDSLTEPTENFTARLSLQTEVDNVTVLPDFAEIIITDNDVAVNNVVIGFVGAPYSANESNGVLFVEVGVLSGTLQVEVVVNISTRDITTLAGSDYDALNSVPLTFSPAALTVRVPVTLVDDSEVEETEYFLVQLSQVPPTAGLTLSPATTNASIFDDDIESTTPRPRTAIIVAVIVIVVILFLICVILMIILILCLCCKKKRSFYILKQHQQHFHDQEDDESQMHQTRYTPVVGDQAADDQGDHQEQNGLSAAISTDNLMQ